MGVSPVVRWSAPRSTHDLIGGGLYLVAVGLTIGCHFRTIVCIAAAAKFVLSLRAQ